MIVLQNKKYGYSINFMTRFYQLIYTVFINVPVEGPADIENLPEASLEEACCLCSDLEPF